MDKVICIVGPTGIGKTKLAIALANYLDTEIINGDAIQMFKEVDILSAKPTIEERMQVKHHLMDYLELEQTYDVAKFKLDATILIKEFNANNKIPIIVGGSGLYLKSLLYDYTFNDVKKRNQTILKKYEKYTNEELYNYLKTIDYEASLNLHMNNRKRVLRAIEIFEVNKTTKTEFIAKQKHVMEFDALVIGLKTNRDDLYNIINNRVDKMIDDGLLDEVSLLYNKYHNRDLQAFKAIGYKELLPYLNNIDSLENCVLKIKQNSRRYAKKQMTWFNNQMEVNWLESYYNDFDKTIDNTISKVKEFFNE